MQLFTTPSFCLLSYILSTAARSWVDTASSWQLFVQKSSYVPIEFDWLIGLMEDIPYFFRATLGFLLLVIAANFVAVIPPKYNQHLSVIPILVSLLTV